MILLLGGTREGRELGKILRSEGYPLILVTVTAYGARLAGDMIKPGGINNQLLNIRNMMLDMRAMVEVIKREGIRVLVDATHPFAKRASENALGACRQTGIKYIRFERPPVCLPENPLIVICSDFEEAAVRAARLAATVRSKGAIFLTVGSHNLEFFTRYAKTGGVRIVARVLPDIYVLRKCFELGLEPSDIIAAQGPFGYELNRAMFREYGARVVVTKESGSAGGTEAKVNAALALEIPVVVVARPRVNYPCVACDYKEVLCLIKN